MTTRKNLLLGALLLIAIAAATILYTRGDLTQPATEDVQMATGDENRAPAAAPQQLRAEDFSWEFRESEEKDDVPQTRVSLVHEGKPTIIGTYAGSCSAIAAKDLQANQVSGALCWYAGRGDEIGVFREGNKYVVKAGVQEESTVDSEGFRGNFKTVLNLD